MKSPHRSRSDGLARVWIGLLQALLVAALLYEPAELLRKPIRTIDYGPHFYAAVHAREHLRNSAALWGYDPFWMAGYPEGHVSLIDNKFFCVLLLLAPAGLEPLVFNAGVLGMLLAVPWLLFVAARAAGATDAECTGAALSAIVATFAVPASVVFWSGGGISFFFASVLSVPLAVTLATTLTERSLFSMRGLAASAGAMLAVFTHPVALPILGLGLIPVLWLGPRPLARRLVDLMILGVFLALPLLPIVEATLWLRGPLRPVDVRARGMFRGGFEQLRLDWWVHLLDTRTVPYGAGGLLALLPLALFGTVSDASPGSIPRPRIARQVILVGIAGCAAVTYLAPMFLGRVAVLQPYRFLIPLAFFACIPAGAAVARVLDLSRERRWLAWAGVALVLAVVGNAVHGLSPLLAIGHGNDAAEDELVAFLERATTEEDRILVESTSTPLPVEGRWWGMMGVRRFALLPLRVRREFLGYIGTSPFTAHRYASFEDGWLFGRKLSELSTEAVSATLRRYAISFAVGCSGDALSGLGKFPNLLEETASAADCRIFRVREPERSRFLEGDGRVRADLDRIEVKEARGERLVLKYHWVPNLKTEPPLPIEEVRESGIPVGFIAVRPEGTEQFTIRPRTPLELASVFGASH